MEIMESSSNESLKSNKQPSSKSSKKFRREIRRLASAKADYERYSAGQDMHQRNYRNRKAHSKIHIVRRIFSAFAVLIFCLLVVHIRSPDKTQFLLNNFLTSYKNNYNQIFYGSKNYCSRSLSTNLYERLSKQVLNQDEGLKLLDETLKTGKRITSIALIGTSGVGKTLLAHSLMQNFPWPDNVHTYGWNSYVRSESERFALLQLYLDGLSDCGRNLLIIDNLMPADFEIVNQMQESLRKSADKNKNVIIMFIFNLHGDEEDEARLLEDKNNLIKNLTKTTVINFRQFDINDLYDCIEHEADLENLSVSASHINEIMKIIDVKASGCKNVFAKVLLYGQKNYN